MKTKTGDKFMLTQDFIGPVFCDMGLTSSRRQGIRTGTVFEIFYQPNSAFGLITLKLVSGSLLSKYILISEFLLEKQFKPFFVNSTSIWAKLNEH